MQINAYLNFNGRCEEAFKFYEKALGGKILAMMPFEGSPMADQMSPEWRGKIIHARLAVGDQILMGSDATPERHQKPAGFSVALGVSDPAEAKRVFHALSEGGKVEMPVQETFWALRFGMLVDRFDIPWMVNCEKPMS